MSGQKRSIQLLGQIAGTHGLRGALKIRTHPGDAPALLATDRVWLDVGSGAPECRRIESAELRKGYAVIQLRDCRHISQAAPLVGSQVGIDPADLERQPGQFFWFELSGLETIDRERGVIGTVNGMFFTAAHGILVIDGVTGEVLLPFLDQFVERVDVDAGKVFVDVPEGLFPET
ncbi:MAG: 16S rRNA processing protein RimM [Desulfuromonas sp.]|nr:MAG: 16S rRNA processing protein RimM [Desulfuromonas sp.]